MKSRLLACVLLSSLILPGISIGRELKLTESEIRTISRMMDQYAELDLFSGAMLLARNGEIVFDTSYGFADRENKVRIDARTGFRLASVSKLFTIVAIGILYDEGRLDPDDTIGKHLSGFPSGIADKVTIRQLLDMSSGFGDYLTDEEFRANRGAFRTVNDLMRLVRKEKLAFEPGSGHLYSNSGFVILGAIIEKLTGKDYFEYVRDAIILPAGLDRTYFFESPAGDAEAVRYKRNSFGECSRVATSYPPTPAGNAVSCIEDLLKFELKVSTTNDLLSEKAKALCFQKVNLSYLTEAGEWVTLESDPMTVFGWTGGLPGVSTVAAHLVRDGLTLIILSNFSDVAPEMADDVVSIMIGGRYREVRLPLTEKIYRAYQERGIESVKDSFALWVADSRPASGPATVLITLGYDLLGKERHTDAIAIFKLNTELFPRDANSWDSLGEAYLKSGDKQAAIAGYTKALEIDSSFASSKAALDQLTR